MSIDEFNSNAEKYLKDCDVVLFGSSDFIQTGHNYRNATEDEMKIVATVIYYCNQLVLSTRKTTNYGAIDIEPTKKPKIL